MVRNPALVRQILEGRNLRSLLLSEAVLASPLDLSQTRSAWKPTPSGKTDAFAELQIDPTKLHPAAARAAISPIRLKLDGDAVILSFPSAKTSAESEVVFMLMAQTDKFLSANKVFAATKRNRIAAGGKWEFTVVAPDAALAFARSFDRGALMVQEAIVSALRNLVSIGRDDPKLLKALKAIGFAV